MKHLLLAMSLLLVSCALTAGGYADSPEVTPAIQTDNSPTAENLGSDYAFVRVPPPAGDDGLVQMPDMEMEYDLRLRREYGDIDSGLAIPE